MALLIRFIKMFLRSFLSENTAQKCKHNSVIAFNMTGLHNDQIMQRQLSYQYTADTASHAPKAWCADAAIPIRNLHPNY